MVKDTNYIYAPHVELLVLGRLISISINLGMKTKKEKKDLILMAKGRGSLEQEGRPAGMNRNEHPFSRGTTRGTNDVHFNSEVPASSQVLKEVICNICGDRTYTIDGKCANQNSLFHKIYNQALEKEAKVKLAKIARLSNIQQLRKELCRTLDSLLALEVASIDAEDHLGWKARRDILKFSQIIKKFF